MTLYEDYKTPTEVLTDDSLSKDQKIEILKQWCEDEEALLRASGEGLEGGERPNLQQVRKALETLQETAA